MCCPINSFPKVVQTRLRQDNSRLALPEQERLNFYFCPAGCAAFSSGKWLSNQSAITFTSSAIVIHGCPPPFFTSNSADPPADLSVSTIFLDCCNGTNGSASP